MVRFRNNRGQSSISLNIVHPEPNNVTLTPITVADYCGEFGILVFTQPQYVTAKSTIQLDKGRETGVLNMQQPYQ
jgi:hypothetical protein